MPDAPAPSYLNTSADPDPDSAIFAQLPQGAQQSPSLFGMPSTLASQGLPLLQEMQKQGVMPGGSGKSDQDLATAIQRWRILQQMRQGQTTSSSPPVSSTPGLSTLPTPVSAPTV